MTAGKLSRSQQAISFLIWFQLFNLGSTLIHIPQIVEAFILMITTGIFSLVVPKKSNFHFVTYATLFISASIILEFVSSKITQTPVQTQRYIIAFVALAVALVVGTQSFENLLDGFRATAAVVLGVSFILNLTGQEVYDLPSSFSWNFLKIRGSGMLAHPNALGLLATLILHTTSGIFTTNLSKPFTRFIQVLSFITLLTTEYRGGMLACAAIIGFEYLVNGFRKKKYLTVLVFSFLGIGVILISGILSTTRSSNVDLTTGRTGIWNQCRALIQNQPFLGDGPLTLERLYGGATSGSISAFHCHNQFLDQWVNFGKLGLLEISIFFVLFCFASIKSKNSIAAKLSFGLIIISLFESPFRFWSPEDLQWQNVIIVAAFVSVARPLRKLSDRASRPLF